MASGPYSPIVRFLRRLTAPRAGPAQTDGELLERFIELRDEAAFTTLVQRHGPMVLGVCRCVLDDSHDAEDVLQATFLVLVRKARSIAKRESVASWLHGVAYRLAVKARCTAARRRVQERQAPAMSATEPDLDAVWRDLRPVLHDEINRLPDRFRKPFVLCCLEGKTNEEAAELLGWPKGTVLSSLSRARERLRDRLSRRGVALSVGLLTTVVTEKTVSAALPPALLEATVHSAVLYAAGPAAATGISAGVLAHAQGFLRDLFCLRLKLIAGFVLAGSAIAAGSGFAVYHTYTDPLTNAVIVPLSDLQPATASRPEILVPPEAKEQRSDRELLIGTWVVTAGEQFGKPEPILRDDRLIFTSDAYTMIAQKGEQRRLFLRGTTNGTWTVNESVKPRALDLLDKGRILQAIYELDGDALKLCVGDPDAKRRPENFATMPDDRRLLLHLKRTEIPAKP